MLYQYFDSQEQKLNAEIEAVERLISAFMSPDDVIRLIELKAKRDALQSIFSDLYKFVVDFDKDFH